MVSLDFPTAAQFVSPLGLAQLEQLLGPQRQLTAQARCSQGLCWAHRSEEESTCPALDLESDFCKKAVHGLGRPLIPQVGKAIKTWWYTQEHRAIDSIMNPGTLEEDL